MNIILGNIFSLFGSICSLISTRAKNYKTTLLIQSLDATFYTISCVFLNGYSGIITNTCAIFRNITCALFKPNKVIKIILIILTFTLGIIFMDRTWYGILPVIASTMYAITIMITEDIFKIKLWLTLNNILWTIYELVILDFVGVLLHIISITSCMHYMITYRNKETKHGN